jgi:hypothetical protein
MKNSEAAGPRATMPLYMMLFQFSAVSIWNTVYSAHPMESKLLRGLAALPTCAQYCSWLLLLLLLLLLAAAAARGNASQ